MKYFNPNYWFKLWVLSAPLFNDKTQGINAKSIDNKKIKDWVSNNTTVSLLENQELTLSNNQTNLLNLPLWNSNLTTHNQHHKHRHQKSRNRLKRQLNINLNVPFIKQEEEFRCGPAIGESILRYFNFIRPNPLWEYQNVLSLEMNTGESIIYSNNSILGTTPDCWQCTINNIIQQYNLNENRIYSLHELTNHYFNYSEFFNIVSNSLINNTPVALAYSGNMPGQPEETLNQHFVLIYAINGNHNNPQNANYYYMDPSTSRSGVFDGNDLYDITKGTNYPNGVPMKSYILFYHTQNTLNKNIIINLNSNK